MPDNGKPDLLKMAEEAYSEFGDRYVEIVRGMRADATRPLLGERLSAEGRRAEDAAFFDDNVAVASQRDELIVRFKLEPDKAGNSPIPRRLAERLFRAAREIPAEEPD